MSYVGNISEVGILQTFIQPYFDAMPNQEAGYFYALLWGFTLIIAVIKSQNMIMPFFLLLLSGALIVSTEYVHQINVWQGIIVGIGILSLFYIFIAGRGKK